jgi:hypothetical protein
MTDTYCYKVSSPLVSPEAPHLRSSFARPEDRCGPVGVDVWIPDFFNCASSHWVTMCCLWWLISKPPLRSGRPPFDANKLEPLMPAGVKPYVGLFVIRFLLSLPIVRVLLTPESTRQVSLCCMHFAVVHDVTLHEPLIIQYSSSRNLKPRKDMIRG